MKLVKIEEAITKSEICDTILRMLPNWFGVETSIVNYVGKVKNMPFYAAETPVGFLALILNTD